jgi:general L-amino acid transport system permease protein
MPDKPGAPPGAARHAPVPFWRDIRVLATLSQVVVLGAVVVIGGYLLNNLVTAMDQKGFLPDLGFLGLTAGFEIAEKVIAYAPSDTYADALLVGLLNTLMVSVVGIVLATLLGLLVGIARLSRNWLVSRLALGYVELFRNTPLLVQLFVLYFVVFLQMPPVRESLALPGALYLNQRGVYLPRPELTSGGSPWLLSVVVGVVLAGLAWWLAGRREAAGRPVAGLRLLALLALIGIPLLGWLSVPGGALSFEAPELAKFNIQGGLRFTPEFAALTVGLALYTAAFIAEIIRGGIEAVSKGQREAARAIGLRESQTLRLVVLPQALRVIIPPLTSQYLNLIKNSSLALAIGYADLFNVSRTISEQTGQPVAVIVIVMAIYLVISLITSVLMNLYNRAVQIPER